MNSPTLSIIVPIYNAEKYLRRCVDSILTQSFADFELILVNDGSKDRSDNICLDFASKDSRIKYIKTDNFGVSAARNTGLEVANGKYVAFVDADDYIDKEMYITLIDIAKRHQADIVTCGIEEISDTDRRSFGYNEITADRRLNRQDILDTYMSSIFTDSTALNLLTNKLYLNQIIKDNNLSFAKRKRGEDWLFNLNYFEFANTAFHVRIPLYKYCRNDNSAMSQFLPEQFDLWLENRAERERIKQKYGITVDVKRYNAHWVCKVIFYIISCPPQYKTLIKKILRDINFKKACQESYRLTIFWQEAIRYAISKGLSTLTLILVYLIRIAYQHK